MKLTDKEIQSLIELGTGDILEYDNSQTMVDLFVEQAGRTPDAIAVADKDSRLTYRELDEQSNGLALRMTYESVENLGPMSEMVYEGAAVFLLAEKEPGGDISKEWKHLLPNMKTIRIDDNHNGLFQNPQHYGLYKRLLLDVDILKKN